MNGGDLQVRGNGVRLALALVLGSVLAGQPASAEFAYTTELVSPGLSGANASGSSLPVALSGPVDGTPARWVLMHSTAANLDPSVIDDNNVQDVYLHDRLADTVTLISRSATRPGSAANAVSTAVDISADGRFVLFNSRATDLTLEEDLPQTADAFLYDRQSGQMHWISRPPVPLLGPFADSFGTTLSANGKVVLLSSYKRLIAGDIDPTFQDVYLYDHDTASVSLLSHVAGVPDDDASGRSLPLALSADGNRVLFSNSGDQILAGMVDGNGSTLDSPDLFLHERSSQTTRLVSRVPGNPLQSLDDWSRFHGMSANGERVLFSTIANSVSTAIDTNQSTDTYLFDLATETNTLVSHVAGNPGLAAGLTAGLALSADGNEALLQSLGGEILAGFVDQNGFGLDLFHYRIDTQQASLVTRSQTSALHGSTGTADQVALSGDGSVALFRSRATDLVPLPAGPVLHDQVYAHDTASGQTTLLSTRLGTAAPLQRHALPGPISDDGNWIGLSSAAVDLLPGLVDRGEQASQAYLVEHPAGNRGLLSRAASDDPAAALGDSHARAISADGRWVLFTSTAVDLTASGGAGPGGAFPDRQALYLRDRHTATVIEVPGSRQSSQDRLLAGFSNGSTYIDFSSTAQDTIPGVTTRLFRSQIYRWNRLAGTLQLLTPTAGNPALAADGDSHLVASSTDGRYVLANTTALDLVSGVAGIAQNNVALIDTALGQIRLLSVDHTGTTAVGGFAPWRDALSSNGLRVLYSSTALNLVAGQVDQADTTDAFLYDHALGQTQLLSGALGSATDTADGHSFPQSLSRDGQRVLINSRATNLIAGWNDPDQQIDPYWLDLSSGERRQLLFADGQTPQLESTGAAMSGDGSKVLIRSFTVQALVDPTLRLSTPLPALPPFSTAVPDGWGNATVFSADGRFLVYTADLYAEQFPDGNGIGLDVLVHDSVRGSTELLSRSVRDPARSGNATSVSAACSEDGRVILLQSLATDLLTGVADGNAAADVLVAEYRDAFFADGFESD